MVRKNNEMMLVFSDETGKGEIVTAGCIVQDFPDSWTGKMINLGSCIYAPRPINDMMKKYNIDMCRVVWLCGKEIWHRDDKSGLAYQQGREPVSKSRKSSKRKSSK